MKKNQLGSMLSRTLLGAIVLFGVAGCSSTSTKDTTVSGVNTAEKSGQNVASTTQTTNTNNTATSSNQTANTSGGTSQSGTTTNNATDNSTPSTANNPPPSSTGSSPNNTAQETDLGRAWRKQPLGKVDYVTQVNNNVLWANRNALHINGEYPRNDSTMNNVYAIDKEGNGKSTRGIVSAFSNYSESADTVVNYVELSNDGKPFIGEHSGQIKNAMIWQYTGEFQNGLPVLKQSQYDVNTKFINQAYSTYAALYTDALNDQLLTYVHLSKHDRKVMDNTNKLDSKLQGDATYKGQVIGSLQKAGETHYSLPKVDGSVELKAHFGETSGSISGMINSNSVGQIQLNQSDVQYILGDTNFQQGGASNGSMTGSYSGSVVGPELNEVVGKVRITNDAGAGYQAVFGAAKQ